MRTFFAIFAVIGATAFAKPIAKPEYGNSIASPSPNTNNGVDDFPSYQNNADSHNQDGNTVHNVNGNNDNDNIHNQQDELDGNNGVNSHVDALPGYPSNSGNNGQDDGLQGSLINLDLEIKKLLDLRVDILRRDDYGQGKNGGEQNDEDRLEQGRRQREYLINLDLETKRLLDLHLGLLEKDSH